MPEHFFICSFGYAIFFMATRLNDLMVYTQHLYHLLNLCARVFYSVISYDFRWSWEMIHEIKNGVAATLGVRLFCWI